jgi:predicted nuclease with TOPRIM domain
MTELRLVEGCWIELDGVRIARLLDRLTPSLLDRLTKALDGVEDTKDELAAAESTIEELEERIEELEKANAVYEKRFGMLKSGFVRGALPTDMGTKP